MATPFPVLCDLDGVVWLAQRPIAGSREAVARLRDAGHRVLFVTNNSMHRIGEQEAALAAVGIPATGDVVTSATSAALLVEPHERVLVCGGPGVEEALAARGVAYEVADRDPSEPIDVVMVGFHRWFDYEVMRRAAAAVRAGARLIATNDDATYPTPDGPIPGGGAILAGIVTAGGVAPLTAGKPYPPVAGLLGRVLGSDDLSEAVMVGDRPDTDGRMAQTLGCRYAHVWSGVTPPGAAVDPVPWFQGADLAAVADWILRDRL